MPRTAKTVPQYMDAVRTVKAQDGDTKNVCVPAAITNKKSSRAKMITTARTTAAFNRLYLTPEGLLLFKGALGGPS